MGKRPEMSMFIKNQIHFIGPILKLDYLSPIKKSNLIINQ